jgi:hypothetical protein
MTPMFQIVLRAEKHPVDPALRLRALLKRAWRDHALRCVGVVQLPEGSDEMRMSAAFPSKYWRAADVMDADDPVTLTIVRVELEEVGQDKVRKPVAYFREDRRGLVLNQTNYRRLAAGFGTDESDDWTDKRIMLEVETVPFGREMVDAIRVRAVDKADKLRSQVKAADKSLELDDVIPY